MLETVIIWIVSATMYGLAALAFGITTIHFIRRMGILAFTMIGMAAPGAPGFAGTYEASFVGGLVFLDQIILMPTLRPAVSIGGFL